MSGARAGWDGTERFRSSDIERVGRIRTLG